MADLHFGFLLAVAIVVFGFIVGNLLVILYLLGGLCAGCLVALEVRRRQ